MIFEGPKAKLTKYSLGPEEDYHMVMTYIKNLTPQVVIPFYLHV